MRIMRVVNIADDLLVGLFIGLFVGVGCSLLVLLWRERKKDKDNDKKEGQ